jgi:pimeloyl-ACP methyl ester carboxylesterase
VALEKKLMLEYGFINQLVKSYGSTGRLGHYVEGPTTLGSEGAALVSKGVGFVTGIQNAEELIIAGYSRGGLHAINACNQLAAKGRQVQLLILFDPVDRQRGLGNCDISAAVQNVILVQRTSQVFVWIPYMRKQRVFGMQIQTPDIWLTNSRWNFGRMVDATDRETLTKGSVHNFEINATHAAFGGLPWTGDFPPQFSEVSDRNAATAMANFANKEIFLLSNWNPNLSLTMPSTGV